MEGVPRVVEGREAAVAAGSLESIRQNLNSGRGTNRREETVPYRESGR